MARWTAFAHDATEYRHDAAALKKLWPRLHAGDAEPRPKDDPVLAKVSADGLGASCRKITRAMHAAHRGYDAGVP